jgi:hypothetical protein
VAVVFPEVVREMGGAVRPAVPGMVGSFLGIGESLRVDREDGPRAPECVSLC